MEETSVHVLCQCEGLVALRFKYFGSVFVNTEEVKAIAIRSVLFCGEY